ncbi:hypothetical protein ABFS82_11G060200 [Erythranthe guttata]|uniref:uncharacterized protein LOC105965472 n=1 Tax=Erythranthe guttata TaxID=4155 RepID=UPI00064DA752|nr:PREDICTED: uncharacterized protein LOC105965472 [Erythranthe guttata]|eukprot:XP_012845470.1 PREDICTED: uncharacterized protein LOC105965472 [Erythranthe guttata]
MCSCFRSSSRRRKNEGQEETISFGVSGANLRGKTVRIIHAGGRIEMYPDAISALKLIEKYPGMCIARPNVFECVHESVLTGDDILLPGNKYFIVRCTTVEKLKRRQSRKRRIYEGGNGEGVFKESNESEDDSISISSARDFFVSKESWLNCRVTKQVKERKRAFVPPIQRPRLSKEPEWEPGLTSIQEISP